MHFLLKKSTCICMNFTERNHMHFYVKKTTCIWTTRNQHKGHQQSFSIGWTSNREYSHIAHVRRKLHLQPVSRICGHSLRLPCSFRFCSSCSGNVEVEGWRYNQRPLAVELVGDTSKRPVDVVATKHKRAQFGPTEYWSLTRKADVAAAHGC
jgi:hypothetical protein